LSFSAAAEDLFVSQPAVTKQVKLFQESCKLKLFEWRKNKLYLTDEGKKVLVYASRIFELEKQLEDTINGFQSQKQGSLHIGTTKAYAKFLMPLLLAPFQKSFPGVIIDLDEGSSLTMTESLLDFQNSLAIIARVQEKPDIIFQPLMLDEIVLIASPQHRFAREKSISFEELASERVVLKEFGSGTRKHVDKIAHDKAVSFDVIAQTSNMDFIKQLVKKQEAISFVVKTSIESELARRELVIVPIENERFMLNIYLAYLRNYELPLAARTFQKYLLSLVDPNGPAIAAEDFVRRIPNKVPPAVCSAA
jgi:DNA-binding transcriptional LysR family regulator